MQQVTSVFRKNISRYFSKEVAVHVIGQQLNQATSRNTHKKCLTHYVYLEQHITVLVVNRIIPVIWDNFANKIFLCILKSLFLEMPWSFVMFFSFKKELLFVKTVFFCHDFEFSFTMSYFFFDAVISFLLWGFLFCRKLFLLYCNHFSFATSIFLFVERFSLLLWRLWGTVHQGHQL